MSNTKENTTSNFTEPFFKRKLPKKISSGIDFLLRLFFLLLMLLGGYNVYDSVYVYSYSTRESVVYSNFKENVEEVKHNYMDFIFWLEVKGTLSEPVVQGIDNFEYLNKGPDGKYALRGAIFLDSRNNADMSEPYTLLYGHHMSYYQMFGALDYFFEEEYWTEEHRQGVLTMPDETDVPFTIFAIGSIDASVHEIFDPTEVPYEQVKEYLFQEDNGVLINKLTGKEELEGKQIICLSTCQTPDSTLRTCVFGMFDPFETSGDDSGEKGAEVVVKDGIVTEIKQEEFPAEPATQEASQEAESEETGQDAEIIILHDERQPEGNEEETTDVFRAEFWEEMERQGEEGIIFFQNGD